MYETSEVGEIQGSPFINGSKSLDTFPGSSDIPLWISVHLHGSRRLGDGSSSAGGNPLARREYLFIYYFSCFFLSAKFAK